MADYIYYNGELYHAHKYITKKKVNGKWRYYYDIGEPTSAVYTYDKNGNKVRTDSNVKGYTKWQDIIGRDEQDAAFRATVHYERANAKTSKGGILKNDDVERTIYTGKQAVEANKAYRKTLLGRLESAKNTIHKGKKAIGRLFIKLGKKLDGDNNSRYAYGMKLYK